MNATRCLTAKNVENADKTRRRELRPLKTSVLKQWALEPERENPKGIPAQSPGLRAASYPGNLRPAPSLPQRGCGLARRETTQPFQGWSSGGMRTRVARSSQPWVGRHNPVGSEVPEYSEYAKDDGSRNWLLAYFAVNLSPRFFSALFAFTTVKSVPSKSLT